MTRSFKLLLAGLLLANSHQSDAQKSNKTTSDQIFYSFDSATINAIKYIGFLKENAFYLTNSKGDTVIKKKDYYSAWEFKDFNKDGFKDIILYHSGNVGEVLDLFIFLPFANKFRNVKAFDKFPAPEKIKGTKYYYSYHKSGCADMNWDSDLFYIENFKAIKIGNIAGRQCDNRDGEKDAVYIHKVHNNKDRLFKTLPIDTIWKYKDLKWGFIKEYWTKNYTLFL